MKNAPIRHRIEYGAYLGLHGILRALPHAAARGLGRGIGRAAFLLGRHRRRIASANLALALPELGAGERHRLARDCFGHFGVALCETLSFGRFGPAELRGRLTLEGWEHLKAAEDRGRGLLLLGAHLGLWEVCAQVIGHFLGPMHVVVRPLDNPVLDADLTRQRGRCRNILIPKRGAARGVLRAIRDRGRVGILIDQRVQPQDGIVVPFFGQPARTSPILARISLRTGAPVVPIFCFPEAYGRYRFVARPPILPDAAVGDPVPDLTARYLAATEEEIRRRPEMWLWMHRRWRLDR